jgi:hypothetical protein
MQKNTNGTYCTASKIESILFMAIVMMFGVSNLHGTQSSTPEEFSPKTVVVEPMPLYQSPEDNESADEANADFPSRDDGIKNVFFEEKKSLDTKIGVISSTDETNADSPSRDDGVKNNLSEAEKSSDVGTNMTLLIKEALSSLLANQEVATENVATNTAATKVQSPKPIVPKAKQLPPTYIGDRDRNGRPHGRGKLTYPNGLTYDGHFKDGQIINGILYAKSIAPESRVPDPGAKSAEYNSAQLLKFIRTNSTPRRSAAPRPTSPESRTSREKMYEGPFVNGYPHGKGTLFYASREAYQGDVWRGLRHGQGAMYKIMLDNRRTSHFVLIRQGRWHMDKYIPARGEILEDYIGSMKRIGGAAVPHGKGKKIYPNGEIYEGEFYNGKRNGRGSFYRGGNKLGSRVD